MKEKIIDYFLEITKIPHCSKDTDKLKEFLEEFAISRGYSVEIDSAKNILAKKGEPKLALQAHYDMVCMGKAPSIETYIKDGWLYAKESSLGADNGMAIAMMMVLMDRGLEIEFLFTNDEEIGLIGATALELDLVSQYMLNVDSEDEAEVYIGCAGGEDILAFKEYDKVEPFEYIYEVSISNLKGGHSGLDIDKDIPNAIKVLAKYLVDKEIFISSFKGGDRRNSIPTWAKAIVSSKEPLYGDELIKVSAVDSSKDFYKTDDFIKFLDKFKQGVYSYNTQLNIPNSSANLAIVELEDGKSSIEISTRAMSMDELKLVSKEILKLLQKYNFDAKEEHKYPSWKPQINDFSQMVNDAMLEIFGKSEYKAVHAGLECGVISQKYPHLKIASIGPNILYPHSIREKVELESVYKTFEVIERIIEKLD